MRKCVHVGYLSLKYFAEQAHLWVGEEEKKKKKKREK